MASEQKFCQAMKSEPKSEQKFCQAMKPEPDNTTSIEARSQVRDGSSSSDGETMPVAKKKRATRRPRKRGNEESKENRLGFGVYRNAVSECYKKLETTLKDHVGGELADEDNDSNNNKGVEMQSPPDEEYVRKTSSITTANAEETMDLEEEYDQPGKAGPSYGEKDRSPSPPPFPTYLTQQRRARRPKAVKQALEEIQSMKFRVPAQYGYGYTSTGDRNSIGDPILENDEIAVKVRNHSGIQRFTMRPNDTFLRVFQEMASKEGVPIDKCIMFKDDSCIEPYMTPNTAKITVADILAFCVRADLAEDRSAAKSSGSSDVVNLQVQTKSSKQRYNHTLERTEFLMTLMEGFARHQDRNVDSIEFYFDGQLIKDTDTAEALDMDDMDCVDAVFI